jgi:hypothetical protein
MSSKKGATFADKLDKAKKSEDSEYVSRRRTFAVDPLATAGNIILPKPYTHKVPNQNFWVLVYAAPEGARVRAKKVLVNCCGAFNIQEEAESQAKNIRDEDNRFDVHVCAMYEYGPVPMSEDVKPLVRKQYIEKYLTTAMSGLQGSLAQQKKERLIFIFVHNHHEGEGNIPYTLYPIYDYFMRNQSSSSKECDRGFKKNAKFFE